MKKLISLFTILILATSAFALKKTGTVVNALTDDEGLKVIIQSLDNKKMITSHYLSNQSEIFLATLSFVEKAKEDKSIIEIVVDDKNQTQIINIQLKK